MQLTMTYYTTSQNNDLYDSNNNKPKYKLLGVCRGSCSTPQGCSCR